MLLLPVKRLLGDNDIYSEVVVIYIALEVVIAEALVNISSVHRVALYAQSCHGKSMCITN